MRETVEIIDTLHLPRFDSYTVISHIPLLCCCLLIDIESRIRLLKVSHEHCVIMLVDHSGPLHFLNILVQNISQKQNPYDFHGTITITVPR